MRNRRSLLAVALLAGTAAPALAQQNLYLVRSIDLSPIHQNRYTSADNLTNGSFFYSGNQPTAVEFDGTNLFIGGYVANALDQAAPGGYSDSTPMPRAARPGTPNVLDTFGLTTNPLNQQPLVAGDFLTQVVDNDGFLTGRFWAVQMVKITLNTDGSLSYVANKFGRDTFSDPAFATPELSSFTVAPGVIDTPVGGFTNISGMDLDARTGRLLVSYDARANKTGKIRIFDVSTQVNPILRAPAPTNAFFSSARAGIGGAAWDYGPTGTGLSYSVYPIGQGVSTFSEASPLTGTGPVVAFFNVFSGGPAAFGPLALAPGLLDYTPALPNTGSGFPAATTSPNYVYTAGDNNIGFLPQNNGPRLVDSGTDTTWRDIDIHPDNGAIVARVQNDLLVAYRSANGSVAPDQRFRIAASARNTQIATNVKLLTGFPGGDVAIWNDRGTTPGNLGAVKLHRLDYANPTVAPSQISVNWLNADGTPFSITAGARVFDFAWHQPSQRLVMTDFDNRRVYIFTTTPPGPSACNIADIVSIGGNPPADGLLTGDDFNAFIAAFAAGTSLADVVGIGGQPPADGLITGDDFNAFIAAFAAGCP
ncbi:MAG: GC-type dockerin domain-anchored protein [bacterium]